MVGPYATAALVVAMSAGSHAVPGLGGSGSDAGADHDMDVGLAKDHVAENWAAASTL
jgi:hypothetical protein